MYGFKNMGKNDNFAPLVTVILEKLLNLKMATPITSPRKIYIGRGKQNIAFKRKGGGK